MITLHQFNPAFGLPNGSPFCMKVETWLRMAGLPYAAPAMTLSALGKAPKGKMPYIVDGSTTVSDSTFIIDYLKATYGDPLDGWLTPEQRAIALAFQRLMEENLYWALLHTRWFDDAGWALTRPAFFDNLPIPLRWFIPPLARRGLRQQIHGQGMGRHSVEEIMAVGRRDLSAVADFLGDKPYMLGEQPCSLDATAYAFLANLLWAPQESSLKTHAQQYPQLEAYCQRMRLRYYG